MTENTPDREPEVDPEVAEVDEVTILPAPEPDEDDDDEGEPSEVDEDTVEDTDAQPRHKRPDER